MKNIKNIIELKNPPEDSNVLWLKDGTLYESTSKGWLPLNESPSITEHYEDHKSSLTYTGSDSKEHTVITDGSFVPNDDGDIVITDSNNEEHTMITEEALNAILANGTVVPTSWQHLKELKDNNTLVPGYLYRITDYTNTTDVIFDGLTSHQFDIILLALAPNTLAEEGWAAMHDNIYDVTFADGITKKCYIYTYHPLDVPNATLGNIVDIETLLGMDGLSVAEGDEIEINEDNKTAIVEGASDILTSPNITYNDFQNTNFATWKIWYSLDNNTARFSWADDSVDASTQESIYIRYGGGGGAPVQYATCIRNSQYDTVVSNINYYCFEADGYPNKVYTRSATPSINDTVFQIIGGGAIANAFGNVQSYTPSHQGTELPNGRGVIYRITEDLGLCKLQWNELKTIRDSKALVADTKYRIVDYQCTTVQENTRSAGHQFDIVLLALSANKLAEEGWAMMHDNIYNVTFGDGITKKCYIYYGAEGGEYNIVDVETLLGINDEPAEYVTINENTKTAIIDEESSAMAEDVYTYNYFQNSNLSAWKVWYCLDNDTNRFVWADDSEVLAIFNDNLEAWFDRNKNYDTNGFYYWYSTSEDQGIYTASPNPQVGDQLYYDPDFQYEDNGKVGSIKGYGRGVIYRLIDEWNNDCPYDFKNIQFIRKFTDGYYDAQGTNTWVYTFNAYDEDEHSYFDATLGKLYSNDENGARYMSNIKMFSVQQYSTVYSVMDGTAKQILNDVVFFDVVSSESSYTNFNVTLYEVARCTYTNFKNAIVLRQCDTALDFPPNSSIIHDNRQVVWEDIS